MRNTVIFSMFGLPVTPYAICVCSAVLLAFVVLMIRTDRSKAEPSLVFSVLALPLAFIGARLFWCLAQYDYILEFGFSTILQVQNGGFALWGAIGGVALAASLTAKITKLPVSELLDFVAPSGALAIALCRFAEYFSGEGVGDYVENPALQFFPLAITNEYDEWQFAVFMAEGLFALVLFIVLLFYRSKQSGNTARLFLVLYSAAQVILESLRRDNFLRWLFLRVSQLTAVLVLAGLILAGILRYAKAPKSKANLRFLWIHSILFLLCVGACIALEFAFDKSAYLSNDIGYLIMLFCCAVMGYCSYQISIGFQKRIINIKES